MGRNGGPSRGLVWLGWAPQARGGDSWSVASKMGCPPAPTAPPGPPLCVLSTRLSTNCTALAIKGEGRAPAPPPRPGSVCAAISAPGVGEGALAGRGPLPAWDPQSSVHTPGRTWLWGGGGQWGWRQEALGFYGCLGAPVALRRSGVVALPEGGAREGKQPRRGFWDQVLALWLF